MGDDSETRVPCSVETRERLKSRKHGGETYDDVINRILDSAPEELIVEAREENIEETSKAFKELERELEQIKEELDNE